MNNELKPKNLKILKTLKNLKTFFLNLRFLPALATGEDNKDCVTSNLLTIFIIHKFQSVTYFRGFEICDRVWQGRDQNWSKVALLASWMGPACATSLVIKY